MSFPMHCARGNLETNSNVGADRTRGTNTRRPPVRMATISFPEHSATAPKNTNTKHRSDRILSSAHEHDTKQAQAPGGRSRSGRTRKRRTIREYAAGAYQTPRLGAQNYKRKPLILEDLERTNKLGSHQHSPRRRVSVTDTETCISHGP